MQSATVPASMEHLGQVMSLTEEILRQAGCGEDDERLIGISVEEIFTNIASYAYGQGEGQVTIEFEILGEDREREAVVCFRDQGIPYNPLERKDPDLGLPIQQRPVGGLGIYMVKKFMDHVDYRYDSGNNVTTMRKRFRRYE